MPTTSPLLSGNAVTLRAGGWQSQPVVTRAVLSHVASALPPATPRERARKQRPRKGQCDKP